MDRIQKKKIQNKIKEIMCFRLKSKKNNFLEIKLNFYLTA